MKLQVSLSTTSATSPFMTKFFKAMVLNPNEGVLASWLFKLPALRLPSIRPATHMFNNRFLGKVTVTATLVSEFPKAAERKLVLDYYATKKYTAQQLDQAMPFLKYMCQTVVNTSTIFRDHFQDEKAIHSLMMYALVGSAPTSVSASVKAKLDTLNSAKDVFDPKSLKDITVQDLTTHTYNELEVAAKINKLTKEWFARAETVEKKKKETINAQIAAVQNYDRKDAYGTNKIIVITDKESKNAITKEEAIKRLRTQSGGDFIVAYERVGENREKPYTHGFLSSYKSNVSFYEHVIAGDIVRFYKEFPDLAAFFILCTPMLTSAINEHLRATVTPKSHIRQKITLDESGIRKGSLVFDKLVKAPWMTKYVSEKVMSNSKLKAAQDAHEWIKIRELKQAEVEPYLLKNKPVLDLDDIENLRVTDIGRIAKLLGVEQSLTSTFKNVLQSNMFKRKFLSAVVRASATVTSPFGKITSTHLGKNMDTADQQEALLSAKSVEKWQPIKEPVASFHKKIMREIAPLEEGSTDNAQMTKELQEYVWGGHNVNLKVLKHWDVPLSSLQIKHLKEAQADPESYVIRDGFHGTSASAAGAVLMSGFRMSSEFVKTAQSMGPVLYIAPNIDKSLQYIGESFGRDNATGIIFHGDLVVKGARPPMHTREKDKLKDWTKIGSFATEEIGLVHPNAQYLVRRAYLVERVRATTSKKNDARGKFSPLVPASKYANTVPAAAKTSKISVTSIPDYAPGQRVVVKTRKDKWYVGTITKVTKKVYVEFDDGATASIEKADFKHIRTIKAKRKNPAVLTDAEALALKQG